ncbi:MAG: fused MFS/spermidine synthase, partial [Flavobacteriales bacterium]
MKKSHLYILSFLEGGSVMMLELVTAKISEPFHGSSILIWGIIMGITLLSLSAGYFLGGMLSKKKNLLAIFLYVYLTALSLSFIIPEWGEYIMESMIDMDNIRSSIYSSVLIIFPPIVLFGMTPPIIIKLLNRYKQSSGKDSGEIFAVSTIGGILFTFLNGFYLLPELGVKWAIIITVLLPSVYLLYILFTNQKLLLSFFFLLIVAFGVILNKEGKRNMKFPKSQVLKHYSAGLFGHKMVVDHTHSNKRTLYINNVSQTNMNLK